MVQQFYSPKQNRPYLYLVERLQGVTVYREDDLLRLEV